MPYWGNVGGGNVGGGNVGGGNVGGGNVGGGNVGSIAGTAVHVPSVGVLEKPPAPDGVKPPTVDIKGDDYGLLLGVTGFTPGYWAPDLVAVRVAAEYVMAKGELLFLTDPGPVTKHQKGATLQQEIERLWYLADTQRQPRLAEILTQAQDGVTPAYWVNTLMLSPAACPATIALLHVGVVVGQVVAMHWKAHYNRPRPVQVYPALMPPVPTPGHPSYPNAHALQSRLMSLCVAQAKAGLGKGFKDKSDGNYDPEAGKLWEFLQGLADRAGENREIAGLHYPSDTVAGKCVADKLFEQLIELKGPETPRADGVKPENSLFARLIDQAHVELNPRKPEAGKGDATHLAAFR